MALAYAALIVYGSLYPFSDWRDQGLAPWAFSLAPWPRYWVRFDLVINVLGYLPLGGLLALARLRGGRSYPWLLATLLGCALSFSLEAAQSYLPARVPSREDWLLNTLGSALGAALALTAARAGLLSAWNAWRARWLPAADRGGLSLLALWPLALMAPTAMPFALGQAWSRVGEWAAAQLADTPFAFSMPAAPDSLLSPSPMREASLVALGLLVPTLLAWCVIPRPERRLPLAAMVGAVGLVGSAVSAALRWGPPHAWAWLDAATLAGLLAAAALGLVTRGLSQRSCALGLVATCLLMLALLGGQAHSPYFAQELQAWEQGRFIRFHGITQWVAWLWPYAVLVYALLQPWAASPEQAPD